jgi:3-hydroxy acid dehydrogenase/malonic semialdehyde reductase
MLRSIVQGSRRLVPSSSSYVNKVIGTTIAGTVLALTGFSSSFSSSSCTQNNAQKSAYTRPPKQQRVSIKDKVVVITGASAGIGEACAWDFADEGCRLVLVARRLDKLGQMKEAMEAKYKGIKVHLVEMSVTDLDAVAKLPDSLPADFKNVSILVNNAGLAIGTPSVFDNKHIDIKTVMDTNVTGTIAFCAAFLPGMKARGEGHIVNMGSIAGHKAYLNATVYIASKHAIHGFCEAARFDLLETPIKVSHIVPGLVGNTEFSNVRLKDADKVAAVYKDIMHLRPEDCSDNVIYAVTRPTHVQIAEIVIYCNNQAGPRDLARVGPTMGADKK